MSKCIWCEKSGPFLKVNSNGLCKQCAFMIIGEAESKIRVINDNGIVIEKSKNIDTILSRAEVTRNLLNDLLKYEQRGLPILKEPIATMLQTLAQMTNERLTDLLMLDFETIKDKAGKTNSPKRKQTLFENYIGQATEVKGSIAQDGNNYDLCIALINGYINESQRLSGGIALNS